MREKDNYKNKQIPFQMNREGRIKRHGEDHYIDSLIAICNITNMEICG